MQCAHIIPAQTGVERAGGGSAVGDRPEDGLEDAGISVPGYGRSKPPEKPKLHAFIAVTDCILAEDKDPPKKQQHTSKLTFEQLRDEYGFEGGITIVKDYAVSGQASPGDVRAAGAPGRTCLGRFRRVGRHRRRGRAQDPLAEREPDAGDTEILPSRRSRYDAEEGDHPRGPGVLAGQRQKLLQVVKEASLAVGGGSA